MVALLIALALLGAVPDAGFIAVTEQVEVRPFTRVLSDDRQPPVAGLEGRPLLANGPDRAFAADNDGSTQQTERWRLWWVATKKVVPLAKTAEFERAVGIAWHARAVQLAVVRPDRSSAYSIGERSSALLANDSRRLAAMAGPPQAALVSFDTNGKELAREPLTEQRPTGLCATKDGWLVMLTEGTLAKGLSDAMIWVRAPDASEGWERIAVGLQTPGQLRCGGAWACSDEKTSAGTFLVHCVSPSQKKHLTSKPFSTNVILRQFIQEQSWSLVFTELSVTGSYSPLWAMPLR